MKGYRTSFVGMFAQSDAQRPIVNKIEIPIIQRDYAQGRLDARADAVREMFLDALHQAVTSGPPVGLDFVYGEIDAGKLEPLDGQQRLTTLFLLHWYVASRADNLSGMLPWNRLTYATRPSARRFCEQLAVNPLPAEMQGPPSKWIGDQSWYLYVWRFDPTIKAMLVMIDAIADRFGDVEAEAAWAALTDPDSPAVWFLLLPVADMGAADDLYIKMNSRGKPLTPFEAFKAHFGQIIEHTGRTEPFGEQIDAAWTDLLWPYRGDNDIVDDEFMRYFDFILEICEWREGRVRGDVGNLERRAEILFSPSNESCEEHLDFVFDAFNLLPRQPDAIEDLFRSFFTSARDTEALRLFGAPRPNVFLTCCERYGDMRGNTRVFSLSDTLLLYAVLVHLKESTESFAERIRVLRNVNEASQSEMRLQNMPAFVFEVAEFVRAGDLTVLKTYNQNQVRDEERKREFRLDHPQYAGAVERLEDHAIIRGTLAAFELDDQLPTRVETFERAFAQGEWPRLTAALLATGEYQRDYPNSDYHLFGSPTTESVWRTVLVDRGDPKNLAQAGQVTTELLDQLAVRAGSAEDQMEAVVHAFLYERETSARFDWRYYLTRYDWMREGRSGIYYGADNRLGYEMTMLTKGVQRSYYRDPYLYAIWREAGSPAEVVDPWFFGYSTNPRWMQLVRSRIGMSSKEPGLLISNGLDEHTATLGSVLEARDGVTTTDAGYLVQIPQASANGAQVDEEDRIKIGAELLRGLVAAGL